MEMLYNSDNYVVVRFEVQDDVDSPGASRGGYEIVDKFARKEIFIDGALADQFREGVEELMRKGTSEEEVDAYLGRFGALMQQPVVLH